MTVRLLLNTLLVVVFWSAVAALVSLRLAFQADGVSSWWPLFLAALPSWLIWAAATPLIFRIAKIFPFGRRPAPDVIGVQFVVCGLFVIVYTLCFTFIDGLIARALLSPDRLAARFSENLQRHWLFIIIVYASVSCVAYLRLLLLNPTPREELAAFENAILITTNSGRVLVEIEKFQYVAGGGRKIMFHTGRTRELTRKRVMREVGAPLVEQGRYRPDRRIVVDLAKIRKGEMLGPNEYLFRIGFSHQLKFNKEMYTQLGGWLPAPVLKVPKPH